jgi:hypothetical protein
VAYLLRAGIVKPAVTTIARLKLSSHHVMATTDWHTTTEKLFEAVCSVQSMLMLCIHNEDWLPLHGSPEMAELEELEVGVRWLPAYKDMSTEAE